MGSSGRQKVSDRGSTRDRRRRVFLQVWRCAEDKSYMYWPAGRMEKYEAKMVCVGVCMTRASRAVLEW